MAMTNEEIARVLVSCADELQTIRNTADLRLAKYEDLKELEADAREAARDLRA